MNVNAQGTVSVLWRRENGNILLDVDVPDGMETLFDGKVFQSGINSFVLPQ